MATVEFIVPPDATRRVAQALGVVLVAVALGHVVAIVWADTVETLDVLDLAEEESIGTWITSALHLTSAALSAAAAVVARSHHSRWAANWWLLAAAFTLMSLDEVAAIHDRLVRPMRDAFGATGFLYYAWVVPAIALGIVFLAVQLRFLRHLGRPTGRDLVLAGVVFVTGAAGLEMVEGLVASGGFGPSGLYPVLVLLEESMELGAVMWVVCILLAHLLERFEQPCVAAQGDEPGTRRSSAV